jgi:protein O-GlcNAc transferase
MLKWIATRFEQRRASLQSRLENSLQPAAAPSQPISSEEWRKRGNAHLATGNLNEAAACYRRGLQSDPHDWICYSNLGYVLGELGRSIESQEMLLKAAELNPSDFDAHYMLGNLAKARGEGPTAIAHYREALSVQPDFDVCRRELSLALAHAGQFREAIEALAQGPAQDPDVANFHLFRGSLHLEALEIDAAITHFLEAEKASPQNSPVLINLGAAQFRRRDPHSAIETYHRLLAFDPENVAAHSNLGAALQEGGQLGPAIQSYRRALSLNPNFLPAYEGLLFALTYMQDFAAAEYLAEARRYGATVAARATAYRQWLCPPLATMTRPLRVGFVSGDLRGHPVGLFLENVLAKIDPAKLGLVAHSTSSSEDAISGRLKLLFAEWHSVAKMAVDALAKKIHADRIDILVDLAGHTEHNQLPVFAWRPAPLQVSWLGYWASTGVAEIDYILVDPVSVPKSDAQFFSEKPWYLPDTRLCMSPPVTACPIEVNGLPALSRGHVTFGSCQSVKKIGDCTLAVWSRVLAQLPSARLRVQSLTLTHAEAVSKMQERMKAAGIDIARVDLHGGAPREEYLASYGEVDVMLDTFPFPGGTTTAEALWMGVPTVTLSGNSLVTRQGASMMRCVGLGDWVATSEQQYVEIALASVNDLKSLDKLRATLRSRALASPLFDAAKFARNLEDAFWGMAGAKRMSC